MALSELQRLGWRYLGPTLQRHGMVDPRLEDELQQAHIPVRPEVYTAYMWFSALLATILGAGLVLLFHLVYAPLLGLELGALAVPVDLALLMLGPVTLVLLRHAPRYRAAARRRRIDQELAYALSYVGAMSSAGVTVDEIFKGLAGQDDIYPEIAREAAWIYRDVSLFGNDVVNALRKAGHRSPSQKWEDVLTGAVTVITSGGDLKSYFAGKAEQYMLENRQEQKALTETVGLMAESYVTVGVAGPLFLMIMMAIMALVGGGGDLTLLAVVIYVMLPIVNLGFAFGIEAGTPEV